VAGLDDDDKRHNRAGREPDQRVPVACCRRKYDTDRSDSPQGLSDAAVRKIPVLHPSLAVLSAPNTFRCASSAIRKDARKESVTTWSNYFLKSIPSGRVARLLELSDINARKPFEGLVAVNEPRIPYYRAVLKRVPTVYLQVRPHIAALCGKPIDHLAYGLVGWLQQ